MPKIHSAQDLHHVSREIYTAFRYESSLNPSESPLSIVASIESARSLWGLGDIAAWTSEYGPLGGKLTALLVRFLSFFLYVK
jgi:citrate lyase subunit beta-like protein